MSFQIATVNDTTSPSRATNFRSLRLGGPAGIVARFVSELGPAAETPWTLPGDRLVTLAGGVCGEDLPFFTPGGDPAPDGSREIFRLESLNGVASPDRTDIVCYFAPQRMREVACGTWDLLAASGQRLCESLSLSGGSAGGTWLWTASPMTLGATVVGGGCSGGCSHAPAKECCGSCH